MLPAAKPPIITAAIGRSLLVLPQAQVQMHPLAVTTLPSPQSNLSIRHLLVEGHYNTCKCSAKISKLHNSMKMRMLKNPQGSDNCERIFHKMKLLYNSLFLLSLS